MDQEPYRSEVRDSDIRDLIEKVRKQSYGHYLLSLRLERIRMFRGAQIDFDFPVTALIGPNGGGKSTILGASACIYASINPLDIFRKSRVGDDEMDDWQIEYDIIDKSSNPTGTLRADATFIGNSWTRSRVFKRNIKAFSITRTLPATENPHFNLRRKLTMSGQPRGSMTLSLEPVTDIDHIKHQAERILGKSLANFQLVEVGYTIVKRHVQKRRIIDRQTFEDGSEIIRRGPTGERVMNTRTHTNKQLMYIGSYGHNQFSEFSFGSGEASVIHMVADIESQSDGSLVLIEEIENGLHPLAVRRMVDYLIDVAERKNIQVIFTTHSDYALAPLPSEGIWASVDGRLQQGKLSVEVLRAVSGRVDKRLAIFVEDEFARAWVYAVIREKLGDSLDEIGVYSLFGDGNAVKTHLAHKINPAIRFHSICFIDGDSSQLENIGKNIFRLPGKMPEAYIFDSVLGNLDNNIALLTVACQRPLDKQGEVVKAVRDVSHTNRDPHVLFSQLGIKLGFVPEATIRGAFLALWIHENPSEADEIAEAVRNALSLPPK